VSEWKKKTVKTSSQLMEFTKALATEKCRVEPDCCKIPLHSKCPEKDSEAGFRQSRLSALILFK
jgi:hypothetical protein